MQTLNKTEQIAPLQEKSGPDRNTVIQDMLMITETPLILQLALHLMKL